MAEILPEFDFPVSLSGELEEKELDARIQGNLTFEVIGKSENEVRVRVKGITLKTKRIE